MNENEDERGGKKRDEEEVRRQAWVERQSETKIGKGNEGKRTINYTYIYFQRHLLSLYSMIMF